MFPLIRGLKINAQLRTAWKNAHSLHRLTGINRCAACDQPLICQTVRRLGYSRPAVAQQLSSPRKEGYAVASPGKSASSGSSSTSGFQLNRVPIGEPRDEFELHREVTPQILEQLKGPEPVYHKVNDGYEIFSFNEPLPLQYTSQTLPQFELAYETWGSLNEEKDNAILIHTGLSASSHARSHQKNRDHGWWEKFIGPGCALDTSRFYVICINVLGGCYGSTGPGSINPETGDPYATDFPILGVPDILNSQFLLLDHLGVDAVYASIGSSFGGMQSLMAAAMYPNRVNRVISISASGRSHPMAIAMRFCQRSALMSDPAWNHGRYYGGPFPHVGMMLARQIATIAYRSGGEWEERFARKRVSLNNLPSLKPDFLIESYLTHQAQEFCLKYDPNSLLYIGKAMDLFDLGEGFESFQKGVSRIKCPTLVIGVSSDILFPVQQQREIHHTLRECGNYSTYIEVDSPYGHDTFLIDVKGIGGAIQEYLKYSPPYVSTERKIKTEPR